MSWCVYVCVCVCVSVTHTHTSVLSCISEIFNNLLTQLPGGADEQRLRALQGVGRPEAQGPHGVLGKGRSRHGPEACRVYNVFSYTRVECVLL